MIINQEKEYKPLSLTLETRDEYHALAAIIDEALDSKEPNYMTPNSIEMAGVLSEYFTNNVL